MVQLKDSIAITGISGRYPKCSNIEELQKSLFAGVDLVTENHTRWGHESLETSHRLGVLKDYDLFDAASFGINPKDANIYDPTLRKLLEVVFEAIVDAGLNPTQLRGTKTGVFLGLSKNIYSDLGPVAGLFSRSSAITANLINHAFDFTGPSMAVDTACSGGLYAFSQAVHNILNGNCTMAVVCAAQSHFDPGESMELLRFGVLHLEGKCRSFDLNRKGYVKSEAIVAVILQKVEESKRIYATVAGVGTNADGFKRDGFGSPSYLLQMEMLNDAYGRSNISPLEVNYVEVHGTGTIVGDVVEAQAIDQFFCKGRKEPLLIGTVKSNVGHSETASSLVSLTKVIIAIRTGLIPGNLHYQTPDPEIKGIYEGRLKLNTKNTPLPSGLVGVNAFGFGGANAHAVLRPHTEKRRTTNNLPCRLVHVSGRTKEAVELMLESAVQNKTNEEFLSLLDNIYNKPIDNQIYRGYAVLSDKSHYEVNPSFKKRPVWFVYSGMGSQWPEMAKDLMKIDVFRNTMQKCAAAVKPYGIDLEDVVTNGTKETFDNLSNTFTAITAVSVCLTDVLTSMKIEPSGFLGHSLGEVGCAYADGLITAEQATLIAYARGHAVTTTSDVVPGLMAAVGLSAEECAKILPKDLYVACDNSDESVTISGTIKGVNDFVQELNSRGIFNKVVNTSNCAFHCPLLGSASSKMYNFVKTVVPESKLRSKRWLSSTVAESEWDTELGRYHSADYHYHNYVSKVEFRQVLKYIPKDAVVIEISPMGLLQSILRRSLDKSVTLLSLVKPGEDNFDYLLSSIGKYYMNGGSLDLTQFYKTVSFPVGIDTPMISNLIRWDHSIKWYVPKYNAQTSFGRRIDIDMNDQSNHFLEGHVVDGKVILPATGYLFLVWTTFAKMLEKSYKKLPVMFKNVTTMRATLLIKNTVTSLIVNICKTTGYFEVFLKDDSVPLSTGWIFVHENCEDKCSKDLKSTTPDQYKLRLGNDDFYKFMHLRGLSYDGIFLGVQECDYVGRSAVLKWNENWIAFMDTMVQYILGVETREHCVPTGFEKIVIHPEKHLKCVSQNTLLQLSCDDHVKSVRCGGVEMTQISGTNVQRHRSGIPPVVGSCLFIPNSDATKGIDSFIFSVNLAMQIVHENSVENLNVKVAETESNQATEILKAMMERVTFKRTTFHKIGPIEKEIDDSYDFLITQDIKPNQMKSIENCSKSVRFIFGKVDNNVDMKNFEIIFQHATESGSYVLFRRSLNVPEQHTVIMVNNNNFKWLEDLKALIKKGQNMQSRIYLVNEDYDSGIVGFFNSMRQEQSCPNLRVFLIRDKNPEPFSLKSKFYLEQIRKDMTVNIYQHNCWGTYRFLPVMYPEPRLEPNASLIRDGNNVQWMQSSPYLSDSKVMVRYAGVNKWDSLVANGKAGFYPGDEYLGLEYSGVNNDGVNVMGLVQKGALSTTVEAHPYLTWLLPPILTLEQAATIPLAFTLSYYGIFVQAGLLSKKSILIHNSKDSVSIAATAMAATKSCSVYVVTTPDQKDFFKKCFPHLQEDNLIIDSEDNPFYEIVLKKTNGRGVDIVFNCHTSDLLRLSTKCITKGGCFVEVDSDIDMSTDFVIEDFLAKSFSYHNITISDIFKESMETLKDMSEKLREESIIPLPCKVLDKDDVESILSHAYDRRERPIIKISTESQNKILAQTRTYMDPDKSYVLIGGLGGLGLELAKWLAERGATKLVLNSRRGINNGYQSLCVHRLKSQGVAVLLDTSDSSNYQEAEKLLNAASRLGPVGGIFNCALVLRDKIISEQTAQLFTEVIASKAWSTQHMDTLSRKLCPKLDYFVISSSITAGVGNTGQTNYGFANSAMERICERRLADGLPALAIEWGAIGDVGILADRKRNVKILEVLPQPIRSVLETLDKVLHQSAPVVFSCVCTDDSEDVNEKKTPIEAIAGLFGIRDVNTIDDSKTLSDLGMDSLLGYEIKYLLASEYSIELSIAEIRSTTVEQIKNLEVDV